MAKYDDLFETATEGPSVFDDKRALDPLAVPDEIRAREAQEEQLARLLAGVDEGYLPATVSIYGPPGTGKTVTVRRLCGEFADRHEELAYEYVNLKECRSRFSIANEILMEVSGERKGSHVGLDGVFELIWIALEDYPEWTVLVLDEIDHIKQDANYGPSEFFYRLLRGEGKRKRELNLSVFTISNELLEVDLRLDSRVRSAMSGEEVFFGPYGRDELREILKPKLEQAFVEGALPEEVFEFGVKRAADKWGDARRAVTLFRQAGETANEWGSSTVTRECIDQNLESTNREAVIEKITGLTRSQVAVLAALVSKRQGDEIVQPVSIDWIHRVLNRDAVSEQFQLGRRRIREHVGDLELMGLVEAWVEAQGNQGRVKQVRTRIDPEWVVDAQAKVAQAIEVSESVDDG